MNFKDNDSISYEKCKFCNNRVSSKIFIACKNCVSLFFVVENNIDIVKKILKYLEERNETF